MSGCVLRVSAPYAEVPVRHVAMTPARRHLSIPVLLLVWAVVACVQGAAAQTGGWTSYTSFTSVRGLVTTSQEVWAATAGGVFGYRIADGEIERYSAVEGLHSVDTRTLAYDARRDVLWIGYQDGVLDRLDTATGDITTYLDIQRARQFSARGIHRLLVSGDTLYVATDFGLVVFDPVRAEVRDAYTRLGSFSPATAVYDLVADRDTLWLGTAEGLAWAPLRGRNLQDPSVWSNQAIGAARRPVRSLARFRGMIYIGTDQDLYERHSASRLVPLSVSGFGVSQLVVVGESLIGVEQFNLVTISADGSAVKNPVTGRDAPRALAVSADGSVWVGDSVAGLARVSASAVNAAFDVEIAVVPDGPKVNQFSDLAPGADGTIWAGGTSEARSGLHRLAADGTWTTFNGESHAELVGRSRYTSVRALGDGSAWAASEGGGVLHVTKDGDITVYTPANSSLLPAAGTTDFVIAAGISTDREGSVWVTTRGSSTPLHVRTPDGAWTRLEGYVGGTLTERSTAYGTLMIDSYDQKWIILRDENNFNRVRGLLVVDTGSSATSTSDDRFRLFEEKGSAGQGLPGTTVTSVVEDRDGLVWIGTDSGIAYFVNTGIVASDASARPIWPPWADRTEGTFVLFGLKVNDLGVDPANRLWIATDEGAWQIASGEAGYELVRHFTAENSPLLSDIVVSVAVDAVTGQVFFATDRGLVAWSGDAVAPSESVRELDVYPNPFEPGKNADRVVISGLVEETDVRIMTPAGVVVASMRARGGLVTWDGTDLTGSPAPSGMYLVAAVGTDGEGTAYGRIALLR